MLWTKHNRYIYLLILCLVFLSFQNASNRPRTEFNEFYSGLETGNINKLVSYLDEFVTISFTGNTTQYSKKQAIVFLNSFFKQNRPNLFKVTRDGNNQDQQRRYSIGELYTYKGNYKIFLFFLIKKNKYFIQQIKMDDIR